MKDTRFFERKCFVISSNGLLEFMKEQKDDNSLTLEIEEDTKDIYLYSPESDLEYNEDDIMECVSKETDVEINNLFVDGDKYCANIYFKQETGIERRQEQNAREVREMKITQREAECLIRHMDSQRMQHLEEREADFCEACCQCSHVQECKSDTWLENTHNLSKIAGVFINPAVPERNHTQDNLK